MPDAGKDDPDVGASTAKLQPIGQVPVPRSPIDRVVDPIVELGFWFFGLWTVAYHLACWTRHLSTTPLLVVSAAATAGLSPWVWRRHRRVVIETPSSRASRLVAVLFLLGAALLIAAAVVLAPQTPAVYPVGWALAVGGLVPLVAAAVVQPRLRRAQPGRGTTSWVAVVGSLAALVVGVGAAVVSLYLRNVSYDDVFYVNKAVFVAERGVIPLRDTVYSDQALPALRGAGTVPVQSIEVLQGAWGHALGFSGGTGAYVLTPLVAATAAVWVMWWLVRSWSRGPAVVAFAGTAAYLAWGMNMAPGAHGSTALSSIFIRAIWQGKVVFLCALLPFLYVVATRWARERNPWDLGLLFLVGAAGVGLTSSAVFLLPPLVLGICAALAACRNRGFAGVALLAAYPIGTGVVVSRMTHDQSFGAILRTADQAFYNVIGHGWWGTLGLVALVVGPWCARSGAARVVAAAGAVSLVVALAPFMPELFNELTGAGPVLWRLAWLAPLPVLVGLLGTGLWDVWQLEGSRLRRSAVALLRGGVPIALVSTIVSVGALIWVRDGPAPLMPHPQWKFPVASLDRAAEMVRLYPGRGTVLAPSETMAALALTTTRLHAVDPRRFFLQSLEEPALVHQSRTILSRTMAVQPPKVPRTFGTHLDMLHVTLVCLDGAQPTYRAEMRKLGWKSEPAGPDFLCFRRPG
ncbi:DUF6077 domain-containing protein [Phycicoccus sp. M110.8]|uniref:DUF6077 domain-containing protein n=1 Tax=Phycicoccus sp. M110.8 TaxID=3075433 RepID=UPI0028FDA7F3|nr:DUF6077 domain-containing protein [Phycicoccus sp. M110.8]MDU0312331.1 DUF6077 domain-containing protein [Phycicoccus sp. M110.8]